MSFLVIFLHNGNIVPERASITQLLNKYEFQNYYGDVFNFTRRAGIGGFIQIGNCVIVRIN